ncbi:MAG: hypothetical protein AB8B96_14540 [Lysobacterales bacterium]
MDNLFINLRLRHRLLTGLVLASWIFGSHAIAASDSLRPIQLIDGFIGSPQSYGFEPSAGDGQQISGHIWVRSNEPFGSSEFAMAEVGNDGVPGPFQVVQTAPQAQGPGGDLTVISNILQILLIPIRGIDLFEVLIEAYSPNGMSLGQVPGVKAIGKASGDHATITSLVPGPLDNEVSTGTHTGETNGYSLNVSAFSNQSGSVIEIAYSKDLLADFNKGGAIPAHLLVWSAVGSADSDKSGLSIQARFMDGQGFPVGNQFQVNNHTPDDQANPSAARDSQGNIVVVWQSRSSPENDDSSTSIQARRFDQDGLPRGDQFQVNQTLLGSQFEPDVAMTPDGGFSVVWSDQLTGMAEKVFIRDYAADGTPITDEVQLNETAGAELPQVITVRGELIALWRQGSSLALRGTFERIFDNSFE